MCFLERYDMKDFLSFLGSSKISCSCWDFSPIIVSFVMSARVNSSSCPTSVISTRMALSFSKKFSWNSRRISEYNSILVMWILAIAALLDLSLSETSHLRFCLMAENKGKEVLERAETGSIVACPIWKLPFKLTWMHVSSNWWLSSRRVLICTYGIHNTTCNSVIAFEIFHIELLWWQTTDPGVYSSGLTKTNVIWGNQYHERPTNTVIMKEPKLLT